MSKIKFLFSLIAIPFLAFALAANSLAKGPAGIIHDAEFQLLQKQYGEKWAAEDKEIEKKLEALRKKHGKRPNIIHILWDDMKYGAIGHPMLTMSQGISHPILINWLPKE